MKNEKDVSASKFDKLMKEMDADMPLETGLTTDKIIEENFVVDEGTAHRDGVEIAPDHKDNKKKAVVEAVEKLVSVAAVADPEENVLPVVAEVRVAYRDQDITSVGSSEPLISSTTEAEQAAGRASVAQAESRASAEKAASQKAKK